MRILSLLRVSHFRQRTNVVYFDQRLGAAHFKSWLKSYYQHFSRRRCEKGEKSKKLAPKFSKKKGFLSLHQNAGRRFKILNLTTQEFFAQFLMIYFAEKFLSLV